jgi:hypothetical protein
MPSDEKMRAWRLAGRLTCTCSMPVPVRVAPFNATECRQCGKRIVPDAVGLMAEVLDALDA